MPYFEWKDSLSTGIRIIDEQHRKLVQMVNALHDEVEASGQSCSAGNMVEKLKAYAAEHFHIEEGYMQAFAYPEFEAHHKEHEAFGAEVAAYESACAEGSANSSNILEFIKNWLTNHITGVDQKMGRFLEDYLR